MTEDDLIKKLKNNESDAYTHLIDMYQQRLYYFCLKILKNSFDAQDAVQMTFIKVHNAISSFKKRACFSPWIYKIALNTCNDIIRSRKKRFYVSLSDITETHYIYSKEENPEEKYLSSELGEIIYKAILSLNPTQQSLIILRDIHGLSYEEISHILSIKEGTVKSGLNRARKKLKEILSEYIK